MQKKKKKKKKEKKKEKKGGGANSFQGCHCTMRLCYVLIDGHRALDVARERVALGDKIGGEGSSNCSCELGSDDVEATLRDFAPRMHEGIDRALSMGHPG
jgi:hypothetical protein